MASSSVRKRRSVRTDLPSVHGFAISRALRAPTAPFVRIHTIRTKNGVLQVNRTRGGEEADVGETYFKIRKTVYPKIVDCVRMASSSVRKRRSARTDLPSVHGFGPRRTDLPSVHGFANSRALRPNLARCARQPLPIFLRIQTIRKKIGRGFC
jgi:hypothetical protein